MNRTMLLLCPIIVLCHRNGHAADIFSTTCSQIDVRNAVDSTANTDTVHIPEGHVRGVPW